MSYLIGGNEVLLCDWQIRNLCEHRGLIKPFEEKLLNPSSVDIRIGNTALVDTAQGFRNFEGFRDFTKENPYKLLPNECLLVATLEEFNLPEYISCELKLKSSRAREGLSHALAGWVDPGFHGVLTLELKNYSQFREINIYPGLRVGQIIVFNHNNPDSHYKEGRYAGHNKVMPSLDE